MSRRAARPPGRRASRVLAVLAALVALVVSAPALDAQGLPGGSPGGGFGERFGLDLLGGQFTSVSPAAAWALIGSAYTLASVDPLTGTLVPADVASVVSPDRAITHDLMRDGLLAFDTQQGAEQARALADEQRRREEDRRRGGLALDRQDDLPDDFDTARLRRCGAAGNDNFLARVDTVVAFEALCRAAEADGVSLQVVSALRTPSQQHSLWRQAVATYGSPEAARRWVAPSDGVDCASNHCRGVAIDVAVSANPAARRWLHAPVGCHRDGRPVLGEADCRGGRVIKRAQLYGFILPLDHEPWHLELGIPLR
jgi:hypothetical protein